MISESTELDERAALLFDDVRLLDRDDNDTVDAEITRDLLSLALRPTEVPALGTVLGWSSDERTAVASWALVAHLTNGEHVGPLPTRLAARLGENARAVVRVVDTRPTERKAPRRRLSWRALVERAEILAGRRSTIRSACERITNAVDTGDRVAQLYALAEIAHATGEPELVALAHDADAVAEALDTGGGA